MELKLGLEEHDVNISADEFRKLVALVDHRHNGDLTAGMFHEFMEVRTSLSIRLRNVHSRMRSVVEIV